MPPYSPRAWTITTTTLQPFYDPLFEITQVSRYHSGFCWSRDDGVALASAEPYASYLHFAPEDNHAVISSLRFLRAGCSSWHPTNSIKALYISVIISMTVEESEYTCAMWSIITETLSFLWQNSTNKHYLYVRISVIMLHSIASLWNSLKTGLQFVPVSWQ